jgi:son of sevenless
LINFNKYHKLARIVQGRSFQHEPVVTFYPLLSDMQRFQVSYNLKEIPEVHEYLKFALEKSMRQGDLQDLYRRR